MIWGGRWEGGSGLGTHVHPWGIHVNVWQNQYSIVKQNKVKIKIKKKKNRTPQNLFQRNSARVKTYMCIRMVIVVSSVVIHGKMYFKDTEICM